MKDSVRIAVIFISKHWPMRKSKIGFRSYFRVINRTLERVSQIKMYDSIRYAGVIGRSSLGLFKHRRHSKVISGSQVKIFADIDAKPYNNRKVSTLHHIFQVIIRLLSLDGSFLIS